MTMDRYTKNFEMRGTYFLISCLLYVLIVGSCTQKDELQIFLCLGQSNMAGRAQIPPEDTITLDQVYLYNGDDTWEAAKNPLNRYSSVRKKLSMQRLGPCWSFAKALSETYPGRRIGLVVNALGGSSIDQWKKGERLYNEAMIRALKAQKTGHIRGVIWHQGESDKDRWETYTDKFDSLAYYLRRDLNIPDLPFFVGEVGRWKESNAEINRVLLGLENSVSRVYAISSKDLIHLGDSSHFDAASQKILGERYAKSVIEKIYEHP
jgi:hypothetical protein